MQAQSLRVGALAVVGERGIYFERDVAVDAARLLVDRAQDVAGLPDVVLGQTEEDLARFVERGQLAQLAVVPVALGQRFLKDRRVARDSTHRVLANQPLELAALEHLARERVDPDALAQLRQLLQPSLRHRLLPQIRLFPKPDSYCYESSLAASRSICATFSNRSA